MDRSYDEVSCIGSLVDSLTNQLNESAEHVVKLQRVAQDLVSQGDFEALTKDQSRPPTEAETETETEQEIIERLEDERIQLVMELQRQDYVSSKLVELMDQNRDIIDSVKDFLTARDSHGLSADDEENADDSNLKRVGLYINHVVRPTETQLRFNIDELQLSINQVNDLISLFTARSSDTTTQLESSTYKQEINSLVKTLNKVYNRKKIFEESVTTGEIPEVDAAEGATSDRSISGHEFADTETSSGSPTNVTSEEIQKLDSEVEITSESESTNSTVDTGVESASPSSDREGDIEAAPQNKSGSSTENLTESTNSSTAFDDTSISNTANVGEVPTTLSNKKDNSTAEHNEDFPAIDEESTPKLDSQDTSTANA